MEDDSIRSMIYANKIRKSPDPKGTRRYRDGGKMYPNKIDSCGRYVPFDWEKEAIPLKGQTYFSDRMKEQFGDDVVIIGMAPYSISSLDRLRHDQSGIFKLADGTEIAYHPGRNKYMSAKEFKETAPQKRIDWY